MFLSESEAQKQKCLKIHPQMHLKGFGKRIMTWYEFESFSLKTSFKLADQKYPKWPPNLGLEPLTVILDKFMSVLSPDPI